MNKSFYLHNLRRSWGNIGILLFLHLRQQAAAAVLYLMICNMVLEMQDSMLDDVLFLLPPLKKKVI